MRAAVIGTLLALGAASGVSAEGYSAGSFRYHDDLPHTLFLIGEVKSGDSIDLRKLLRERDIEIVVTASPGGSLYEGIQIASIINDKGLSTYVPKSLSCESACSLAFFGGEGRVAAGGLGVHQFYTGGESAKREARQDVVEATTQYTTSDIIAFLNDFGTPPFVYEKMFGTMDMYYFNDEERVGLARDGESLSFPQRRLEIEGFLAMNPHFAKVAAKTAPVSKPQESAPPTAAVPPTYEPARPAPSRVSRRSSALSTAFESADFFGSDLYPKGIKGIAMTECDYRCQQDPNCVAWSYVHKTKWCWPKSGVSSISFAVGITSGIVEWSNIDPDVIDDNFMELTAVDFRGGDIYPSGLRGYSLRDCRNVCKANSSCVAYSWVANKNACFPKYTRGAPVKALGIMSGVKH